MAHITKATRGQVVGLLAHDERTCENHTNEKIRPEDTYKNYNLSDGTPLENYKKIMSEVHCRNRKDVNTLAMISVTLPKNVRLEDQEKFFQLTHNFLSSHFGSERVVSSIVHNDETTPHLHFKAVPTYYNEKKQQEQVSFKIKCPRNFYQSLHKDLSKHIEKELGYHVDIENGATKNGNLEVSELKQKTEKIEKEMAKYKNSSQELKKMVGLTEESKKKLNQTVKNIENKAVSVPFINKTTLDTDEFEKLLKMAKKGYETDIYKNSYLDLEKDYQILEKSYDKLFTEKEKIRQELLIYHRNDPDYMANKFMSLELLERKKQNELINEYNSLKNKLNSITNFLIELSEKFNNPELTKIIQNFLNWSINKQKSKDNDLSL